MKTGHACLASLLGYFHKTVFTPATIEYLKVYPDKQASSPASISGPLIAPIIGPKLLDKFDLIPTLNKSAGTTVFEARA